MNFRTFTVIILRYVIQVELSCPKEMAWKVNLYRGYIAICHPDDHHLNMVTVVMYNLVLSMCFSIVAVV